MSLNRANMLVDTNSPKLARADINDMFADLGYSTIGNVSPITTTGEANKLVKFSAIANTILHFLRIRRSSTTALDVQNDSSTSVFNVDTTNEVITGTSITTTGGANKLVKFSAIANTILHFLRIRKSSTTALSVQDDSSVDVLNVDSTNKIVTSYNQKITSLAGTGNRMVLADASGNLSAGVMAYAENSYNPTLSSTGQTGSWTYNVQYGKYIRIGNKLTLHLSISWSAKPSTGTNIKISLPAQVDVYALRGFLGEYSGITFTGKQLGLSNGGTDSYNIYLFQNLSGGSPAGINVSDVSSSGYINCVIETLVI